MIIAPTEYKKNLEYRRRIVEMCRTDLKFREECWIQASRDLVWYCNTFCYTYNPKDYPDEPVRPFTLWPFQVDAVTRINNAIGKTDILMEKSRDLGASWLCLLVIEWRWHFRPNQTFLLVSRIEDLVDKKNEPDSLMWKIDMLHKEQPGWLVPARDRSSLSLHNLVNGSSITGASTTGETGRGGRKTAILLDEFAAVKDGYSMLKSTRDATNTRIMNSTPKGAAGAYYDQRQNMVANAPERVIRLHWSSHPTKRAGLYTTEDGREGGKVKVLDGDYSFPADYNFIRDGKLRSVWYDEQSRRAPNPQEIAQELDIDYQASGWQFFDARVLKRLVDKHARRPMREGEIILDPNWESPKWIEQPGARLKLWFEPTLEGKVPQAWDDIGIACDIASGSGGEMSSNSSASIVRRATGEKIGEFTTNLMNPHDFATYVLGLCKWMNGAVLAHERNGPNGAQFTKTVKDAGYRNVAYFVNNQARFAADKSKEFGWWSDDKTKPVLLRDYAQAMIEERFINHSQPALEEAGQYVQEGDQIYHSRALVSEDPTATGASHGDRVIADALANRLVADLVKDRKQEETEPPPNSYRGRRLEYERDRSKMKRGWGQLVR